MDYLNQLKQYIHTTYNNYIDSKSTESVYLFTNNFQIRISKHLPNHAHHINIIKTQDDTDTFIIVVDKKIYLQTFDGVKTFINSGLNSIDRTTPLINNFNKPCYIDRNWKLFESELLNKDLPWYSFLKHNDKKRIYVKQIICKCIAGKLSYKETLSFIGQTQSSRTLYRVLEKAKDLYDSDLKRSKRYLLKYDTKEARLNNWDTFLNDLYKALPWMESLAKTNKNIIFRLYKKDVPIMFLLNNMINTYKQYNNMKYTACIAYKNLIKEKIKKI